MKRLLILACSATKRPDPGLLPALERYQGMGFLVLARSCGAGHARPHLLILSAAFGLLNPETPILDYNQRMTVARASEIQPLLLEQWPDIEQRLQTLGLHQVHVHAGAAYRAALRCLPIHALAPVVTWSCGGIGIQLAQLKRWLVQPA
jgi:hypothetical protein